MTHCLDTIRLLQYSQAAGLLGCGSVLICETTSSGLEHYALFQMTCVGLGLAAGACFVYTGLNVDTQFDCLVEPAEEKSLKGYDDMLAVLRQTGQIFAQRSFISFVLMNFCATYHATFLANFTKIIGDRLLGTGLSSSVKSALYGSLFIIPQVCLLCYSCRSL